MTSLERGLADDVPVVAPPRAVPWRHAPVLGACALSFFSGVAQFAVTAVAGDVADVFGTSRPGDDLASQLGLSATTLSLALAIIRGASIFALPATSVADRLGRRRVLLFTAAAGLLATALAAGAPTFWVWVALVALARPFLSTVNTVTGVVAAEETDGRWRSAAVAMIAASYGVGAGVVSVGRSLLPEDASFRPVMAVSGLALLALPLVARLVRDSTVFRALVTHDLDEDPTDRVQPRSVEHADARDPGGATDRVQPRSVEHADARDPGRTADRVQPRSLEHADARDPGRTADRVRRRGAGGVDAPDAVARVRARARHHADRWLPGALPPELRACAVTVSVLSAAVAVATGPGFTYLFVYGEQVLGASEGAMAAVVLAAGPVGGTGLLLGRWAADRLGRRVTSAVTLVLTGLAVGAAYQGTIAGLYAGYLVAILASSAFGPAFGALIAELFPTVVRSTASAWAAAAGVVGAVSGLALFGLLADVLGSFEQAAPIVVAPVIVSALLFRAVPETRGTDALS